VTNAYRGNTGGVIQQRTALNVNLPMRQCRH